MAFILEVAPGDNRADMVGEFRRHPEKALKATFALERMLREDMQA